MSKMIELELNGKIIRYTPEELSAILAAKFSGNPIRLPGTFKCFTVIPLEIDHQQFYEKRADVQQEAARAKIVSALQILKINPKKYESPFELLFPVNTEDKPIRQLKEHYSAQLHCKLDYSTNIDEFLKWAFMLQNGLMTWEELSNNPDHELYPRLIRSELGSFYAFGGGRMVGKTSPAATIDSQWYFRTDFVEGTVPQFKRYLNIHTIEP